MSVIGQGQFSELCQSLPADIPGLLKEAPCAASFQFGNNSMVTGKKTVFFLIGPFWMKVIVVPSNTPFLIANSVFRSLGAANDTDANQIFFQKAGPINPNCADRAEAVSPRHDGSLDSPTNCPKNAEIRMCRSQF